MAASKAAVLGSPVAHSLSPVLHNAAYAALGLAGWTYQAIECNAAGLPGLLDSLGPDWAGLSLTMPLKQAVLPLLDWAEPLVGQVGGANTVVFANGARAGYNTDVPGMTAALRAAGVGGGPGGLADVLVLGTGATACAALAALAELGTRQVTVAVRDQARARQVLHTGARTGVEIRLQPFAAVPDQRRWQLILSTVPVGGADVQANWLRQAQLSAAAVFDVVYSPWPTELAAAAGQAGAAVIGGFELLLHQAAGQVELMTGQSAPVAAMRAAGEAELTRRSPCQ